MVTLVASLVAASAGAAAQSTFTVPPRTVGDITATLEQFKPDPAKLAETRAKADAPLPANAAPRAQADFLAERAQMASLLGRQTQALADAREAVRLARESNHSNLNRIQGLLGNMESAAGNVRTIVEINRARANNAQTHGQQITSRIDLASALIRAGALEDAARQIDFAVAVTDQPGFYTDESRLASRGNYNGTFARLRANLAAESGQLADAERFARQALAQAVIDRKDTRLHRAMATVSLTPILLENEYVYRGQNLVSVLQRRGKLVEAEAEGRRVLTDALQVFGRYSINGASSILQLARVLNEQGRYRDAAQLATIAVDTYRELGMGKGSVTMVQALMFQARTQALAGQVKEALATFRAAGDLLIDEEQLRIRYVEGDTAYAATLLSAGEAAAAVPVLERLVARQGAELGERHIQVAQSRALYATALMKSGDTEKALAEFRTAMPIMLQASRAAEDDSGAADRDRRTQQIVENYIDLLSRVGNRPGLDVAGESFLMADTARARGVQRALAASAARASIGDPALAKLVRDEQDTLKQINAQFGLLANILSRPPDQQDGTAVTSLRASVDKLRNARAAAREEIERRFPDYASLIDPRPVATADVQKLLRPGEAMLSVYLGRERSYVWAIPAQGAVAFAPVEMNEAQVASAVAELRLALDPQATTLGEVPRFDVAAAYRLYAALIAPVASALAGVDSLVVVPDKSLGQLPLGLLVTENILQPAESADALFVEYRAVPFLVRKMAVTQLPSVSALGTLRRIPAATAARKPFAGFGDPWFSAEQAREGALAAVADAGVLQARGRPLARRNVPATQDQQSANLAMLPRLPDTADEVRSVALALRADPSADVFLGAEANEVRVKGLNLSDRRVVMFATHGLVPGDLDGLEQPALALTAPAVANVDGDGLLTLDEILGLRLNADWVVLSACNTGAADGAGAEVASGLGRAFFYAGTRAVLLSNWPVETTSARELTTDLFRRQADDAKLTRAQAFRQAKLALIDEKGFSDNGKMVFSYAHPIFWAPFSVIGDGGN